MAKFFVRPQILNGLIGIAYVEDQDNFLIGTLFETIELFWRW